MGIEADIKIKLYWILINKIEKNKKNQNKIYSKQKIDDHIIYSINNMILLSFLQLLKTVFHLK
jgi:hypothetical protein